MMASRKEAMGAVLRIAKRYGYISDEVKDKIPPEVLRIIQESMDAKDKMIGHSIRT